MDALLARAMQGVDPNAPGAFWQVFANLMGLVPWGALFWWNLGFVAVGALLGAWRGRVGAGIVWALLLGPIGWIVILPAAAPAWTATVAAGLSGELPRRGMIGSGIFDEASVSGSLHTHHHDTAAGFVGAVEQACEARGLRLTPLRREVLQLVAHAGKPVKAYDLLDRLRESHGSAAPPTVYRALDFLVENGFVHKLESINAFVSCHHPAESHQVPFLICDTCASAQEVCDVRVAELIEAQAKAFGFRAQAQTLEVHGLCRECSEKRPGSKAS